MRWGRAYGGFPFALVKALVKYASLCSTVSAVAFGFAVEDPKFDENTYAEAIATTLGVDPEEVHIESVLSGP